PAWPPALTCDGAYRAAVGATKRPAGMAARLDLRRRESGGSGRNQTLGRLLWACDGAFLAAAGATKRLAAFAPDGARLAAVGRN
ncbi:hypothetical protein, partial [Actinoplanes sp. NPDC089786]|uniref:hypothetical protein n=1 Tax=Actinoplanes sp. NPDC089786 TaxID=3155185 RepID=UPI00343C0784